MFKRILVPIDGSRTSDLGLDEAIRMAQRERATLCLLHVVDESVLSRNLEVSGAAVERLLESLRESGQVILARAASRLRKRRVRFKTVLVENILRDVAGVIVGQAKKWRADLIVIGTHGRRGLTRMVMGSDAEGVVRMTPVPVLLVRSGTRQR